MAVNWTTELVERGLDLRINHGLSWAEVLTMLKPFDPEFYTPDQPRIKLNRVLNLDPEEDGYVAVPPKGKYKWDFSLLVGPEEDTDDDRTESDAPYEVTDPYREQDYLFDGESYTFTINGKHYTFPKDVWESIVTDYSDLGGGLTRQEIALKYGGNFKVIEAALRKYGTFKASPPATREEIAEAVKNGEDFTPLMDRAVEAAQRRFSVKLERHKLTALQQENLQLKRELHRRGEMADELRALLKELADELPVSSPIVPKDLSDENRVFHVHAPVFDPHIGLQTFHERGWTTDYSTDIAVRFIRQHAVGVVRRIQERYGRCGTVYLSLGGDIFHSILGRTLSGRHVGQDRPDRFLMRAAVPAFIDWIETVRPYAERVHVLGIGGNHDGPLGEILVDFLALHYRDAHDVKVDDTPAKQAYFIEGDTLHVLDHGESFNNVTDAKALATAERIARRVAGSDYYRVRRVIFYVGHMHHRESATNSTGKTQGHLEIIRVPVFCSASDYEETLGFWNEQMADVFFLSEDGRIAGVERIYATELDLPSTARFTLRERVGA